MLKNKKLRLIIPFVAIAACVALVVTTLIADNIKQKNQVNMAEIPEEVRAIVEEKLELVETSKQSLEASLMSESFGAEADLNDGTMYIDENGNYVIEGNEQLLFVDNESDYNVTGIEKKVEVIVPISEEGVDDGNNAIDDMLQTDDKQLILTATGGSNSGYNSDSSGSVRLYLTISYVTYTSGGMHLMYIQNVSGSISAGGSGTNVGSGVVLKNNYVQLFQKGMTYGSGYKSQSTSYSHSAGTRSWQHSAPSSWYAVEYDTSISNIGGIYTVTLGRGSSTWSAYVNVHVDNGGY